MRNGKSINTYSGIEFWPLDPREEEIEIVDIAHALSLLCRGNGHLKHFYSVAQHSIRCAKEAEVRSYSKRVQLACLLHDGSEAYISDITRPVKALLDDYLEVEEELQRTIYIKYGLEDMTDEENRLVKLIDDTILVKEMKELMGIDREWSESLNGDYSYDFEPFDKVEKEFVELFKVLLG